MAIQERDPRAYELMTVFVPELSEEDAQSQVDKVATYISNAGGSLTETLTSSPWGRRRLAYTIRFNGVDYRDGIYTVYHFDSAPSNLTELERDLKLDTNTIRYLLVHDDPKAGEKFSEAEGEEGDEAGVAEAATAAGETAQASATAVTAEPETATAESESDSEAPTEVAEAAAPEDTAPNESESTEDTASSESDSTEDTASSESDSTEDSTEQNEDESTDKE